MGQRFYHNFLAIFLVLSGAAFLILRGMFGVNTEVSFWWGIIPIVIGWVILTIVHFTPQGKPTPKPTAQKKPAESPKKYLR